MKNKQKMDLATQISRNQIINQWLWIKTPLFPKLIVIIFHKFKKLHFKNKISKKIYLKIVLKNIWFLIVIKVKRVVFKRMVKRIKKNTQIKSFITGKAIIILKRNGIIKKGILSLILGEIIKMEGMSRLQIIRMIKTIRKLNSEFSLIF